MNLIIWQWKTGHKCYSIKILLRKREGPQISHKSHTKTIENGGSLCKITKQTQMYLVGVELYKQW